MKTSNLCNRLFIKIARLVKGSHTFGLVILDCELYWTHVQISAKAIEKASMVPRRVWPLYIRLELRQ